MAVAVLYHALCATPLAAQALPGNPASAMADAVLLVLKMEELQDVDGAIALDTLSVGVHRYPEPEQIALRQEVARTLGAQPVNDDIVSCSDPGEPTLESLRRPCRILDPAIGLIIMVSTPEETPEGWMISVTTLRRWSKTEGYAESLGWTVRVEPLENGQWRADKVLYLSYIG